MQIDFPDSVIDTLLEALTPVIDRLIDERVEQRRPLLLSVTQVAEELSCSRGAVYGLINGGHLEAIRTGRSYRVATSTLQQYVEELTKPSYEREVVSARSRGPRTSRSVASGNRDGSRRMPSSSVLPASRPPRAPRPKQKKMSKKEIADTRCTVAEFADRWWGLDSASALLERAGIVLSEGADGQMTFRYGDIVEWMENHHEQFEEWVERFDPMLMRRGDDGGLTSERSPSS
jgi:excisionase family DNA binding protein